MHSWHALLLILYVMDSLFFATPKSQRVLLLAWRHTLLTRRRTDSLFFATPNSKRFLSYCIPVMLLLPFVLDSLFLATPKSKRVLMHAWRYLFLVHRFADLLFFFHLPCVGVFAYCLHVSLVFACGVLAPTSHAIYLSFLPACVHFVRC